MRNQRFISLRGTARTARDLFLALPSLASAYRIRSDRILITYLQSGMSHALLNGKDISISIHFIHATYSGLSQFLMRDRNN